MSGIRENCLLLMIVFLIMASTVHSCHMGGKRRKRQAGDLTNATDATYSIDTSDPPSSLARDYFCACLQVKAPYENFDWTSNVDFTFLSTNWYMGTRDVLCWTENGYDTSNCWQTEIEQFVANNELLPLVKACISEYFVDFVRGVYTYSSYRKKREVYIPPPFPLDPVNPRYVECLQKFENSSKLDFAKLLPVISSATVTRKKCSANSSLSYPISYAQKLFYLTRREEKLHRSIDACNKLDFAIRCEPPSESIVQGGSKSCTGYNVGDSCECSCPNRPAIAHGDDRITCQIDQRWASNVSCCEPQCPPLARMDIFFLLDSSSSLGKERWNTVVNFVSALLDSFVIGADDMRVGVARFNRWLDRKSEILVGEYPNVDSLKKKLQEMPYNGRGSLIGKALKQLVKQSLSAPGNRPNVADVVVVITDGKATDDVKSAAQAVKDKNVKIYAVGFRNRFNRMDMDKLTSISSGPDYVSIITEGHWQLSRDLCR